VTFVLTARGEPYRLSSYEIVFTRTLIGSLLLRHLYIHPSESRWLQNKIRPPGWWLSGVAWGGWILL
jgi:hypothetical protein